MKPTFPPFISYSVLSLRRQRGAAATARVGLQPRQLPADPGAARLGEALVTRDPARPARENRRQDRPAWPVDNVPDGRGRGAARAVPEHPDRYRGTPSIRAAGPMLSAPADLGRADCWHRRTASKFPVT